MQKIKQEISEILIEYGRRIFEDKPSYVTFTGVKEADDILNDLHNYPHAFFIACLMDRQVKAEKAWLIPYKLKQKINGFSFNQLSRLTLAEIEDLLLRPEPLHRFPGKMADNMHAAIRVLRDDYNGNAANLWNDSPNSAEIVLRFMQFRGIGPKIATMAANLLARYFKIEFDDYYSIDISVDVHVRRVFGRLGLTSRRATQEEIVYTARALSPEFPGLLDLPCWKIGRNWCRPKHIDCNQCFAAKVCPKIMSEA